MLICAPVTLPPRCGDILDELGLLPPGLVPNLLKKLPINSRRIARISSMVLSQVLGVCEFYVSFGGFLFKWTCQVHMEKLKLIFILCSYPETDDYSSIGFTCSTLYFSSKGMVTFVFNRND